MDKFLHHLVRKGQQVPNPPLWLVQAPEPVGISWVARRCVKPLSAETASAAEPLTLGLSVLCEAGSELEAFGSNGVPVPGEDLRAVGKVGIGEDVVDERERKQGLTRCVNGSDPVAPSFRSQARAAGLRERVASSRRLRSGGLGPGHMIESEQHNRSENANNEACGLSFLIPAQGSASVGRDHRSRHANQAGDNDSAWILARHNKFRHGSDDEPDQKRAYQVHTILPPRALMVSSSWQLFR